METPLNVQGFAHLDLIGQDDIKTWTPVDASGAGLTFTAVEAFYYRVGRMCFASATLTYPATVNFVGPRI